MYDIQEISKKILNFIVFDSLGTLDCNNWGKFGISWIGIRGQLYG